MNQIQNPSLIAKAVAHYLSMFTVQLKNTKLDRPTMLIKVPVFPLRQTSNPFGVKPIQSVNNFNGFPTAIDLMKPEFMKPMRRVKPKKRASFVVACSKIKSKLKALFVNGKKGAIQDSYVSAVARFSLEPAKLMSGLIKNDFGETKKSKSLQVIINLTSFEEVHLASLTPMTGNEHYLGLTLPVRSAQHSPMESLASSVFEELGSGSAILSPEVPSDQKNVADNAQRGIYVIATQARAVKKYGSLVFRPGYCASRELSRNFSEEFGNALNEYQGLDYGQVNDLDCGRSVGCF